MSHYVKTTSPVKRTIRDCEQNPSNTRGLVYQHLPLAIITHRIVSYILTKNIMQLPLEYGYVAWTTAFSSICFAPFWWSSSFSWEAETDVSPQLSPRPFHSYMTNVVPLDRLSGESSWRQANLIPGAPQPASLNLEELQLKPEGLADVWALKLQHWTQISTGMNSLQLF